MGYKGGPVGPEGTRPGRGTYGTLGGFGIGLDGGLGGPLGPGGVGTGLGREAVGSYRSGGIDPEPWLAVGGLGSSGDDSDVTVSTWGNELGRGTDDPVSLRIPY
jgi:hypothetical protein